jgi:large subunit ribosomal protein L35
MPKTKTHSGAKKRFKVTASGNVKHDKPAHSHFLTNKTQKRKRGLRQEGVLTGRAAKNARTLLGQ